MGMGEPLDNPKEVQKSLEILADDLGLEFGGRRITVSTVGTHEQAPCGVENGRLGSHGHCMQLVMRFERL